jgi:hypothetical protein
VADHGQSEYFGGDSYDPKGSLNYSMVHGREKWFQDMISISTKG